MKDYQKNKFYQWEDKEIISKDSSNVSYDNIQNVVNYIWEQEGLEYPPKVIPIDKRNTTTWAKANRNTICCPSELPNTIILHELSHSMTSNIEGESAKHGARFVGVYMNLLSKYANFDLLQLMYSAKQSGIDFNFKGKVI